MSSIESLWFYKIDLIFDAVSEIELLLSVSKNSDCKKKLEEATRLESEILDSIHEYINDFQVGLSKINSFDKNEYCLVEVTLLLDALYIQIIKVCKQKRSDMINCILLSANDAPNSIKIKKEILGLVSNFGKR